MARHHAHEQHGSRAHRHWWLLVALTLVVNVPDATAASEPICAIDMGSNTFRRIVGSFDNGRYSQAKDERITVGVGDDVASHGRISDSMLVEIEKVLSAFKAACAQESTAKVVAVGTAAFRDAPNGRQVVDIAASLGIPMEIATEKRESELAYLVGSFGRDDYAVIDNGSRSIELVSQHRETTRYLVMKLGYRVASETFFAGADDPEAATIAFRDRLKREAAGCGLHEEAEEAYRRRVWRHAGSALSARQHRGARHHARSAEAEAPRDHRLSRGVQRLEEKDTHRPRVTPARGCCVCPGGVWVLADSS